MPLGPLVTITPRLNMDTLKAYGLNTDNSMEQLPLLIGEISKWLTVYTELKQEMQTTEGKTVDYRQACERSKSIIRDYTKSRSRASGDL